jgi:hypothetical protein
MRAQEALWAIALAALVVASGFAAFGPHREAAATTVLASPSPALAPAPFDGSPVGTSAPRSFDAEVARASEALAAAGLPRYRISLPFTGPPSEISNGVVVPGTLLAPEAPGALTPASNPFPTGIAYFGESEQNGSLVATSRNASSVVGELDASQFSGLYFATDYPDYPGIQLNSIVTGVTVQGTGGLDYWCQNIAFYIGHNDTISLAAELWNSSGGILPSNGSTVAAFGPTGALVAGLFAGAGPFLYAPRPFNLTLYSNTSLTPQDDQEVWFNYTLAASGQPFRAGTITWLVFNSTNARHPVTVTSAAFQANGKHASPVGLPLDFELDLGIGSDQGATMDMLDVNATANLSYCPSSIGVCTRSEFVPVPAATDYGGETGETGLGLSFTYAGTTATVTSGPSLRRDLWGYSGVAGAAAGATPVANGVTFTGAPDPGGSPPYAFVFFNSTVGPSTSYAWAPDVPVWYLAPGTYTYAVMLADYRAEGGTLVVGSSPTSLALSLPYAPTSGVYTPLWSLDAAELPGISSGGSGTVGAPYRLFDSTTAGCTFCGGAPAENLSPVFYQPNDYHWPAFPGLLLTNSSSYAELDRPVSFGVGGFDLPLVLYATEHVTIRNASAIGGWPLPSGFGAGATATAAQDIAPAADLTLWNSSDDLVMSDRFVAVNVSSHRIASGAGGGLHSVSPDQLLLYGGTNNTVWGNVFQDPRLATLSTGLGAVYGGVAEDESGDLIYNNNFSIDNPTLYLPYDLYTGVPTAPPTDRWNISNQSAGNVAEVVNGIPLRGNVLGPAYPTQGGNYWWNDGDPLNPTGTLPYVDTFDYTNDSGLFPAGASLIEASIRAGGDSVPLRPLPPAGSEEVVFREVGLPTGTAWSVGVGTPPEATTASAGEAGSRIVVRAPNGSLAFTVGPPAGFGVARVTGRTAPTLGSGTAPGGWVAGSVDVSGATSLTVQFGLFRTLTFQEVVRPPGWPGLPSGTDWTVTLSTVGVGYPTPPPPATTNGSSVAFTLPHGVRYAFEITKPATDKVRGGHGFVTEPGANLTRSVEFAPYTAPILFVEQGLPAGTPWSIQVTGPETLTFSGTGATARLFAVNGTYTFSIGVVAGRTPNPANGTVLVAAPHPQRIVVTFSG